MTEDMMRVLCLLLLAIATHQVVAGCKNCALSKDERAMFRAHSDACLPQSGVDRKTVDSLLRGETVDSPELRRHVYCMMRRCKMIGKDGKLLKTTLLSKMARGTGRNVTKMMERCADQSGDSPEELAWRLFRCGYDKKALMFHTPPRDGD